MRQNAALLSINKGAVSGTHHLYLSHTICMYGHTVYRGLTDIKYKYSWKFSPPQMVLQKLANR